MMCTCTHVGICVGVYVVCAYMCAGNVYMYEMCIYDVNVYACGMVCVCVRVWREARGQSLVSTHQGCCPLFSNGFLLAWNSPNRSGSLASESQRFTCLCFPPLGFQEHVMMPGFHSNHRSSCVGGHTLLTEASLSPIILILYFSQLITFKLLSY